MRAQAQQEPTFEDPFAGDCPELVARKLKQDAVKFKNLLNPLNLYIKKTKLDGNCLFRAIADQLFGQEYVHTRLRQSVV